MSIEIMNPLFSPIECLKREVNSLVQVKKTILNYFQTLNTDYAGVDLEGVLNMFAQHWPYVDRHELCTKIMCWIQMRWMEIDSDIHELDPSHPSIFSEN
jgi:hypothetical protein